MTYSSPHKKRLAPSLQMPSAPCTTCDAGELIVTDREFDGFDNYLRSFPDNDALVRDLHVRFKFLGVSVAHMFLYGVSFDMPSQEAWAHEHFANAHHRR